MNLLPKHWKEEHVIACLVRHLMIVDSEVIQGEMDWMTKTAEDYSIEGVDVSGVWDDVDDDIVNIFPIGSKDSGDYHILVNEAINYVDQNFDHEKKQTLLHYLSNMAAQDDIVKYPEFLSLKLCIDCWFPGQLDVLLNDLQNSGIKIITNKTSTHSENADQGTSDENKTWNIIHDIGVFYMYFANLAEHPDGDLKDEELNFIGDNFPKWNFNIDGIKYGLQHDNPKDLQTTWDYIFGKMYENGDPMPRVNESHRNIIDYLNNGSFQTSNLETLLSTLYDLCMADENITEGQKHQLTYYCEHFKPNCDFADVILGRLNEKSFEKMDEMFDFDAVEFDLEGKPIGQNVRGDTLNDSQDSDKSVAEVKLTLQGELANELTKLYPKAEVKKIDDGNYLDVHMPDVHPKRGTHIWFNTPKAGGIKVGFFCRDKDFIEDAIKRNSGAIEIYSNGLRPAGHPVFDKVGDALKAANDFIEVLTK
tara:strand:+ start:1976 stop:3403 length:1428 start_codon:yes stop_codon:yes gene_type:complete